jgi:hypothetical protein
MNRLARSHMPRSYTERQDSDSPDFHACSE